MANEAAAISSTMADAMKMLREAGKLTRMPGGFWVREGTRFAGNRPADTWFGTPTIEALVRRGLAEYCDWQGRRGGGGFQFPIAVRAL